MTDQQSAWHLDRRVPITLFVTIGLQVAASIWWASGAQATINTQAVMLSAVEARLTKMEDVRTDQGERLARIETQMENHTKLLNDILQSLRAVP